MKKIVRKLIFKINTETIACLELDEKTIFDVEEFKQTLADELKVDPMDIDVEFKMEQKIEYADFFIGPTGRLFFYDEMWNVKFAEGISVVDSVDLKTSEGIDTLSDYIFMGKADELLKFI
jgi:hypothetical protein